MSAAGRGCIPPLFAFCRHAPLPHFEMIRQRSQSRCMKLKMLSRSRIAPGSDRGSMVKRRYRPITPVLALGHTLTPKRVLQSNKCRRKNGVARRVEILRL